MVAFAGNKTCPAFGGASTGGFGALGAIGGENGYRYDPESDNYYVRNRYHAPILGRWLTRDPIGTQGGMNLYAYVASNSVGVADPSGFFAFVAAAGATDLIGGGPADPVADATAGGILVIGGILLVVAAVRGIAISAGSADDACKSGPSERKCAPCIPPVGTICVTRVDFVPPSKPHHPYTGSDAQLLIVRQNGPQAGCRCFLNSFGVASPDAAMIYAPCPQDVSGGGVVG